MSIPISIKGVCLIESHVLLLKNDRGEWELPGGRLEGHREQPEAALVREFREETGVPVAVRTIIDAWLFEVISGKHVFIVTYLVVPLSFAPVTISSEHMKYMLADPLNLPISLPHGYVRSIERTLEFLREKNDPRTALFT